MDKRLKEIKELNTPVYRTKNSYLRKKGESGYLIYRIFRPFLKLKYKIFRQVNSPSPWLSPVSIIFLKKYLTKDMSGIEFGSGYSTLFFSPKVKKLFSIEHHEGWYLKIKKELNKSQITNVDYRLFPKNDSQKFKSEKFDLEQDFKFNIRRDYVKYFRSISDLPDESVDFILVDGRARTECAYYSIAKLKKGGIFILDNSERDRYNVVFDFLSEWEMQNTTNGLTDTTFWVKPNN